MMDASSSENFENVVQNVLKFEGTLQERKRPRGTSFLKDFTQKSETKLQWEKRIEAEINSQKNPP